MKRIDIEKQIPDGLDEFPDEVANAYLIQFDWRYFWGEIE